MAQLHAPVQSVQVLPAAALRVSVGANQGDGIGVHDDLMPDDIYVLDAGARRLRLGLAAGEGGFRVAEDTALGRPGAVVHLDCVVTFMSPDGLTQDEITYTWVC